MYNSKKIEYKGEKFDSRKELDFYQIITYLRVKETKTILHFDFLLSTLCDHYLSPS
ncbi:DUF1064 domain-containing protein [Ligilactobacillus ruminis]|uniref:DUF1064 domain-containing protein n=1 Tax=Ligilactobacillus ruminis TaxID=1623 RepID=UPI003F9CB13C